MPTPEKVAAVEELTDKMRRAKLAVVTDYRGLKVRDLATLRRALRPHQVDFTIAKNTLLRIAANNAELGSDAANELLSGPTGVAFCYDDIVQPAKAISDFARTSRILSVRGAMLGNVILGVDEVTRLATLPPVDELRAEAVGVISGPLSNLVGVFNGLLQTLVGTLEAQVEAQGGAGEAAAA
jgi:large subunit ribosomal protein L10